MQMKQRVARVHLRQPLMMPSVGGLAGMPVNFCIQAEFCDHTSDQKGGDPEDLRLPPWFACAWVGVAALYFNSPLPSSTSRSSQPIDAMLAQVLLSTDCEV